MKEELKYVRVMVEVPLNKTYSESVLFENETGQIIEQAVEYERTPTLCNHCKNFGHTKNNVGDYNRSHKWYKQIKSENQ